MHNLKNETRFRDLLLHGKKGALLSTLIRLTNTYGVKQKDGSILIDCALTNQELANFCATSREVVNRILNDLKKKEGYYRLIMVLLQFMIYIFYAQKLNAITVHCIFVELISC